MDNLFKSGGLVFFTTIRRISININSISSTYGEDLPASTKLRRKRKRRTPQSRKRSALAVGFYRLAKYGLLMWLIAAAIFLVMRSSVDLALDLYQKEDAAAPATSVTSQIVANANHDKTQKTEPDTVKPVVSKMADLQGPEISKLLTLEKPITHKVTGYDVQLWHAIDGDDDYQLLLQHGAVVDVIDINGEWMHVRTEAGLTGFVHQTMIVKLNQ